MSTEFEPSAQLRILGKLHLVIGSPAQLRAAVARRDAILGAVRQGRAAYDDDKSRRRGTEAGTWVVSTVAVRIARPWFHKADSDARTAEALLSQPAPMRNSDVGCHVAAMCAQAVEKSLKGYVFLNGGTPAMDHRPTNA